MMVQRGSDGLEELTHTPEELLARYHKAMGVVRSQRWR